MKKLFDDNYIHGTLIIEIKVQMKMIYFVFVLVFLLNLVDGGFGLGFEVLRCFQGVVVNSFKCFFNFR